MTQQSDNSTEALLGLLNAAPKGGLLANKRRWLLTGGALALLLGGVLLFSGSGNGLGGQYISEEVALGNLLVTA